MRVFFLFGPAVLFLVAQPAFAQNFSVMAGQPDLVGGFPPGDDILGPGPAPVLPGLLGPPSPISEVDAFSAGRTSFPTAPTFLFSVDSLAVGGLGTAVAGQAALLEAQTDVFHTFGAGLNTLYHDGDGSTPSTAGPLGLSEGPPFGTSPLGVDAYEANPPGSFPGPFVFWSVDTATAMGNPTYFGGGALPGDIFLSPPVPGYAAGPAIYASALTLGLSTTDDIDALEVYDIGPSIGTLDPLDIILFSLTPGSPTVLGGLVAPGDILASSGGGSFGLFAPDVSLGLAPGDNLNALSVIPEPSSFAALALGCIGLLRRRRR